MTRRVWFGALGLVLLLAACGSAKPGSAPVRTSFVPQTVDFIDDVGYSPSLALDKDGNPHLSYLGFTTIITPAEKKAGVIPPARPVYAPRLPAVLTVNQVRGLWNRGAADQSSKQADGPTVPIDRRDQTTTAVDANGVQHVVWTQKGGLFYSNDSSGTFPDQPTKITGGSVSGPSIAIDDKGAPWVSFYTGTSVEAATLRGESWTTKKVASVKECARCPSSISAIRVGPSGPVIAFTDAGARTPVLATLSGNAWSTQPVNRGAGGFGISMALDPDGNAHVAYLQTDGTVDVSTQSGGSWQIQSPGAISVSKFTADLGGGTAVAVDGKDHQYVAWTDPKAGILLARSSGGGGFKPIGTEGTDSGHFPSMAATPDGQVELAWFRAKSEDLMFGTFPQSEIGPFALPSPSPTVGQPSAAPGQACAKTDVDITAPPGAATTGFATTRVDAPGTKPFVICFDNGDSTTHNVAIFKNEQEATSGRTALFTGGIVQGPTRIEYKVNPIQPGSYFFRCDVHPTVMTGTLAVK